MSAEYGVVIRRGPDCLNPNTAHLLPNTIHPDREKAEESRAWYERSLYCAFPRLAKSCRYVVVELTEVS